jgi:hypothetical protein
MAYGDTALGMSSPLKASLQMMDCLLSITFTGESEMPHYQSWKLN